MAFIERGIRHIEDGPACEESTANGVCREWWVNGKQKSITTAKRESATPPKQATEKSWLSLQGSKIPLEKLLVTYLGKNDFKFGTSMFAEEKNGTAIRKRTSSLHRRTGS